MLSHSLHMHANAEEAFLTRAQCADMTGQASQECCFLLVEVQSVLYISMEFSAK